MVKVRTAASPAASRSSLGKRKRSEEDIINAASSSKRSASHNISHGASPGKSAHFPKVLVSGPTPGNYERARSQSPVRSALHRRGTASDGPGAQLRAEIEAGLTHANTPRLYPNNKDQETPHQRSPNEPGKLGKHGETSLTQGICRMDFAGSTKNKKGRAAKKSVPVVGSDEGLERTPASAATSAPLTDDEICEQMDELRSDAMQFAKSCPPVSPKHKHGILRHLLVRENEELVRYIGCLAVGGPAGEQSWETLLGDTTCRRALVLGIIGRALKENVFNELYFGGSDRLVESLSEKEMKQTHQDGFFRTKDRAAVIRKNASNQDQGANFRRAVTRITLQLECLLYPLWEQGNVSKLVWAAAGNRQELARIVVAAGQLSRSLRTASHVVYNWPPTFKDEEFEPGRMECLNLRAMISESPYDKKDVNGFERAVLRDGHQAESEAIVRVVCFPGLVAYRQYGGDLAKKELLDEENEKRAREGREKLPPDVQKHRKMLAARQQTLTGDEGFRTRVISKSVVLLQWGKQRLLTKEAGTSRHIDAMKGKGAGMKKYHDDYSGFEELHDLYDQAVQTDPQRGSGIVGAVTGWFSRSPSASAEPPARTSSGGRAGSGIGRPVSRGR